MFMSAVNAKLSVTLVLRLKMPDGARGSRKKGCTHKAKIYGCVCLCASYTGFLMRAQWH